MADLSLQEIYAKVKKNVAGDDDESKPKSGASNHGYGYDYGPGVDKPEPNEQDKIKKSLHSAWGLK